MADHSKPSTNGTDAKLDVLTMLMARIDDAVKFFRGVTPSNIPDGTVRFNDSAARFEKWVAASSSWVELAVKYGINVEQVDGYDAAVSVGANKIAVRDGSAKLPGDITGDAATVAGRKPTSVSGGTLVELVSGKVPVDYLPDGTGTGGGTGGYTVSEANTAGTIPLRSVGARAGWINAHVAGNIGSPNDNYGTGQVGSATDFMAVYGKCMGGSYGANSGVLLTTVPGTYNWTAPHGVNKMLCIMWGGGGGFVGGAAGGNSSFADMAVAYGGGSATSGTQGTAGNGGGVLGQAGKSVLGVIRGYIESVTVDISVTPGYPLLGSDNHMLLGQMHGVGALVNIHAQIPQASGNGGLYMDFLDIVPDATYPYAVGAAGVGTAPLYALVTAPTHGAVLLVW